MSNYWTKKVSKWKNHHQAPTDFSWSQWVPSCPISNQIIIPMNFLIMLSYILVLLHISHHTSLASSLALDSIDLLLNHRWIGGQKQERRRSESNWRGKRKSKPKLWMASSTRHRSKPVQLQTASHTRNMSRPLSRPVALSAPALVPEPKRPFLFRQDAKFKISKLSHRIRILYA